MLRRGVVRNKGVTSEYPPFRSDPNLRVSFPKTCTPLIVDPPRFPSKFVFWQMLMRNEQKLEILVIC